MATDLPYDYRKSRSRSTAGDMTQAGRRPSFGTSKSGETFIRGFRSRPGAPQAANDTMANLTGMRREPSGFTNNEDWGSFFKGNSPVGVRMGYKAASPQIAAAAFPAPAQLPQTPLISDNPTPLPAMPASPSSMVASAPTAPDYLGTVISNAQDWMKRNGYA